jgi:uncharacterized membrane protein (UPF0127 family)
MTKNLPTSRQKGQTSPKTTRRTTTSALQATLALGLAIGVLAIRPTNDPLTQGKVTISRNHVVVASFDVEIAETDESIIVGLGGRPAITNGNAMLLDLSRHLGAKIWMKGMLIPIDVIFAKDDGTVISIERELAPGAIEPRGPDYGAVVALEIQAGAANAAGISVGDRLLVERASK